MRDRSIIWSPPLSAPLTSRCGAARSSAWLLSAVAMLLLACAGEGGGERAASGDGEAAVAGGRDATSALGANGGAAGAGAHEAMGIAGNVEAPAGASGQTGGASSVDAEGAAVCLSTSPSPSPLRRLTRLEYNNTVRDLLKVDIAPADDFPPDEVAGGFSNNANVQSISPLLAEKYMEAAEALAAEVMKRPAAVLPCDPMATGEQACARQFIASFGRRVARRPLSDAESERWFRAYTAGREGASFENGVELVVRLALQSPAFLYRLEFGVPAAPDEPLVRLTQHELATRLSYFLLSSMPDEKLLAAADAGELSTLEQVASQARALLAEPRARTAVAEFYRQWLGLGALEGLGKDRSLYPEFDESLRGAMRAETAAFVEHVLWTGDRKLGTLLTAPIGFVSGPLAALYGVDGAADASLQRVSLDPQQRAGVLTQAAVLAVHALPNQSSPVARGKFVRERLLCQEPPSVPPELNVTPPEVDPASSTRERFAEHTANAACASCHELMDPIGFGFEHYDAVGRFRDSDGGRAVDSRGFIVHSDDLDGPFANARELAEKLAGSRQVSDCVAGQWFRYAFGRFEAGADACSLQQIRQAFSASGGDLLELLVALTQSETFLYRRAVNANGEGLVPEETRP